MYDNNAVGLDFETEAENNVTSKNDTTDEKDVIAVDDNSSGLCFCLFSPLFCQYFPFFSFSYHFLLFCVATVLP